MHIGLLNLFPFCHKFWKLIWDKFIPNQIKYQLCSDHFPPSYLLHASVKFAIRDLEVVNGLFIFLCSQQSNHPRTVGFRLFRVLVHKFITAWSYYSILHLQYFNLFIGRVCSCFASFVRVSYYLPVVWQLHHLASNENGSIFSFLICVYSLWND